MGHPWGDPPRRQFPQNGFQLPALQPPPATGFAFFPETGHNVGLAIKRFYDTHGGIDIFGLPLTEVFEEEGLKVQYFERARFELHPELAGTAYEVQLGQLGVLALQAKGDG